MVSYVIMRERGTAFFDRMDRLAFWVVAGVTFAVYALSLGPSVGLEDAGELATAADVLGVPHPPGYPLWTMLSWVFCRLFGWVTWQGWPNPAWAVALCSAVAGALAAGFLAAVLRAVVFLAVVLAVVFLVAVFLAVPSFFTAVFFAAGFLAAVFFLVSEESPSLVVFLVVMGFLLRRLFSLLF